MPPAGIPIHPSPQRNLKKSSFPNFGTGDRVRNPFPPSSVSVIALRPLGPPFRPQIRRSGGIWSNDREYGRRLAEKARMTPSAFISARHTTDKTSSLAEGLRLCQQ